MDIKIDGRKFETFSLYFFLLFIGFICLSCSAAVKNNSLSNSDLPEWVLNPSKDGIVGGVGYCAAHINGVNGQRELASKRALEEIARQKGVYIDSIMVVSSKSSNQIRYTETKSNTVSSYHTKNIIKAYIKEIWVHPVTKVMYVYMVSE